MNKIFSKTAFTLMELIVALALFSVILLGIVSINIVLNNNGQDYGQRYLVKSETQITLNQILNNASLAIGSVTTTTGLGYPDQAIIYGTNTTTGLGAGDAYNANSFCIHQPANGNIIQSPSVGYNEDIWLCYTFYGAAQGNIFEGMTQVAGPNQIYWCTYTYSLTSPYRGANSCDPSILTQISGPNFLGSVFSIPTVTFTPSTALFTITLDNCLNNATPPGTCNGSGAGHSSDTANNPEVQLTGSVTPPQVSAN